MTRSRPKSWSARTRRPLLALPATLALLTLLGGCASDVVTSRAEYLPAFARESLPERTANPRYEVLRLHRVQLAGHLRGLAIARSDGRIDLFVQSGFAQGLEELCATAIVRAGLREGLAGIFLRPEDPLVVERELAVRVASAEIVESASGPISAVVRMEAFLRDLDGRLLATASVERKDPVLSEAPSVAELAEALGLALEGAAGMLCRELLAAERAKPRS